MRAFRKPLVKNRLSSLRKDLALTQWRVSLASGVRESRLSKLENGLPPSHLDVERLTAFYGVPFNEIWPDMIRDLAKKEKAKDDEGK
jgi:transcriptional regulator with XRE-family HTH domain